MQKNSQWKNISDIVSISILSIFFGIVGAFIYQKISPNTQVLSSNLTVNSVYDAVPYIVAQVNPAVVSIEISQKVGKNIDTTSLEDFFGVFIPNPEMSDEKEVALRRTGGGSGFIVDSDGLIVTNKHVVKDDDAVYVVRLTNGETYEASVVAKDPLIDLALLKIDKNNLPTLSLGNSSEIKIGERVIAIGYALAEFGNTVTTGVISGVGRSVVAGDGVGMSEVLNEAIQTDAAINPGNSGGPLLNIKGEVIGVNTAVSLKGQSVGFAIPVNRIKRSVESVKKFGTILRPWIGIKYVAITPKLAMEQDLPVTYGVLVVRGNQNSPGVIVGAPADKAGIKEGDILLEIDGLKLDEKDSLSYEISKRSVGDSILLKILRGGKEQLVTVTLEVFPIK